MRANYAVSMQVYVKAGSVVYVTFQLYETLSYDYNIIIETSPRIVPRTWLQFTRLHAFSQFDSMIFFVTSFKQEDIWGLIFFSSIVMNVSR